MDWGQGTVSRHATDEIHTQPEHPFLHEEESSYALHRRKVDKFNIRKGNDIKSPRVSQQNIRELKTNLFFFSRKKAYDTVCRGLN